MLVLKQSLRLYRKLTLPKELQIKTFYLINKNIDIYEKCLVIITCLCDVGTEKKCSARIPINKSDYNLIIRVISGDW